MFSKTENGMIAKFADIDDFNSQDYRENFFELEEFSNRFLKSALKFDFFPKDYPWPIDPFHNWSRIWEYPFVWQQIKDIKGTGRNFLRIADLGSGLTFFPWFLAGKGNKVCALDNNSELIPPKQVVEKMKNELNIKGNITYLLSDANKISLRNNSVDAVTSISLLEHLPDFQASLRDANRILAKKGKLIATFDVSLDGLPFGDGKPLNLNQVNKMTKLQFKSIPVKSLRFSNHPKEWSDRSNLKFNSFKNIWKWNIKNQYLRPLLKIINSRLLIKPYSNIIPRGIKLLFSPARLDMWTVMGVVAQKSSIKR
jgi:ubiquinone/menaquinone biosynthesis C-methylase UbiE